MTGRSLELYYIDGHPDGMLTAEMFNWTGHVLMTPRTRIATALARPEAGYAGIYLLIGEQDGEPRAYVGESEDIGARIRQHDVRKEWWTSAVLVSAAANKLNKAHVRYLEARLIAEARSIGRVPLDNMTNPLMPALSEADRAKMEAFLENILIVLPAVRVDMFIQRSRPAATTGQSSRATPTAASVRFILQRDKIGLNANAVVLDGEFVVMAGSLARKEWEGREKVTTAYAQLYAELRRSGILAVEGTHCRFTQNYAFRSPSAAAAVALGRTANGTLDWKESASGITYKDWESGQLAVTNPA